MMRAVSTSIYGDDEYGTGRIEQHVELQVSLSEAVV